MSGTGCTNWANIRRARPEKNESTWGSPDLVYFSTSYPWLSLFRGQLGSHFLQPITTRLRVRPERLQRAFAFVEQHRAVQAERRGVRRVDQARGITRAHLEGHAHFDFAER